MGHFLQLSAKNVPWRFPPRSGQHAKAMATGTLSEGPWFRLNTETGTAPEKGQSRTSRAGANASLPVIPSVKAPPVELPAFFRPFLRDKKGQTAFLEYVWRPDLIAKSVNFLMRQGVFLKSIPLGTVGKSNDGSSKKWPLQLKVWPPNILLERSRTGMCHVQRGDSHPKRVPPLAGSETNALKLGLALRERTVRIPIYYISRFARVRLPISELRPTASA